MKKTRSLNCVFVGHVDHGKTSILDKIRGTAIAKAEPGLITQTISSTTIPFSVIKKICGKLLEGKKITIPGILAIDSPGHEAFTNLRKRGGNLADIAVLVIDIKEGFKPQTKEAVEILKQYKTPFVIAANKLDLLAGWQKKDDVMLNNINKQATSTKELLDKKLYELVGEAYKYGFNAERFDRIKDYTKQIAIIPISALTGEGIAEILMVLAGLAQKFLEKNLEIDIDKPGKATILEVKEEKGIGITLDVILYNGRIKKNDKIVIGGVDKAIVTKVRALLEPENKKLKQVNEVIAASGVKISAPNLKEVVAGMPLLVVEKGKEEEIKKRVQKEVQEVLIETDIKGIVVKADSLGSLEALINLLKQRGVSIKRANIGEISKKDVMDAKSDKDELNKVVLGFNVKPLKADIKVVTSNVIYSLVENYEKWLNDKKKEIEAKRLAGLIRPCKIRILHGYIFRQNNPAVVGIEVLNGNLTTKTTLMKDTGQRLVEVKSIQSEGKNVNEAKQGEQVAIALQGITVGRQIIEAEVLYSDLEEDDVKKLRSMKKFLKGDEIEALKEIVEIKRKKDPLWGI